MDTAGPSWTDIITEPDTCEWPVLLNRGCSLPSELSELRATARSRIIDVAQQYVLRLAKTARQANLSLESSPVLTGNAARQAIVLTGHEPVIFHSGLTFKYAATEKLAIDEQAIGVAVVVDTGTGDSGQLVFPRIADGQHSQKDPRLTIGITSLCPAECVFAYCEFVPAAQLSEHIQETQNLLKSVVPSNAYRRFQSVMSDYRQLAAAGAGPTEAHSIVRWLHGVGSQLLEIPFTTLCSFPEFRSLTSGILERAKDFSMAYNEQLQEFRMTNGIRNEANPFPDLQVSSGEVELPFWVIDGGQKTRTQLHIRQGNGTTELLADREVLTSLREADGPEVIEGLLLRDILLVPRGAMITAFLRLLFADLFVHGTGGGKYDHFTNQFIRAWWSADVSPFVIASASQYLFAEQRQELRKMQSLRAQLRDLMYNPQRHFGEGVFSPDLEQHLDQLTQQKAAAVEQMKTSHSQGASAKDIGHRIQKISDQMREAVRNEFEGRLSKLISTTAETQAVLACRTWPWFLHD